MRRQENGNVFRLKRRGFIFLFATALTLTFWILSGYDPVTISSSDYICCYAPMAQTLLKGQLPDMQRAILPLGYSVLLAPWFFGAQLLNLPAEWGAAGLALLFYGASGVVVYALAELFWEWKRALAAALLWACLPPILWLTRGHNSEIPFMFFFYLGLFFFWRATRQHGKSARGYFFSGIFVGAAMLIRGIGVGLGVVLAFALFLIARERPFGYRLTMAAVLLAGNLIAILPWEWVVFQNTGRVVAVTSNDADSMLDGLTFGVVSKNYRAGLNLSPQVMALMQDALAHRDELSSPGAIARFLWVQANERPAAVVELLFIKLTRSFYGTDSQHFENLFLAFQIPYLLVVALGAYYSVKPDRNRARFLICWSILVLYFWGMTILVLPIVRYMTPILALGCLMLPGLADWARQMRDQRRARIASTGMLQ